jgi:hypothetical protein
MVSRLLFLAFGIACPFLCGCSASPGDGTDPFARSGEVVNEHLEPTKVAFDGGTSFDCDGDQYQLLGIKDFDDAGKRQKAEAITRAWFRESKNRLRIMNGFRALRTDDGARLIWLWTGSGHGGLGCLNETLMETGLVKLAISPYERYKFKIEFKIGPKECPWQEELLDAKKSFESGKESRALDWLKWQDRTGRNSRGRVTRSTEDDAIALVVDPTHARQGRGRFVPIPLRSGHPLAFSRTADSRHDPSLHPSSS